MAAISRRGRAPTIFLIAACWLGFAAGFFLFWADGVGAALLAGVLAGNASVGVAALVLALRTRRKVSTEQEKTQAILPNQGEIDTR